MNLALETLIERLKGMYFAVWLTFCFRVHADYMHWTIFCFTEREDSDHFCQSHILLKALAAQDEPYTFEYFDIDASLSPSECAEAILTIIRQKTDLFNS